MALLDDTILSCIFDRTYMDFAISIRLQVVSRKFQALTYKIMQRLTRADVKRWPDGNCIDQTQLTCTDIESFDAMSKFSRLTRIHFVSFKFCPASFSYLQRLPKLASLSIDSVFADDDFDFDRFRRDIINCPKLFLRHLSIQTHADHFLQMCHLGQLKSLKISLPDLGTYEEYRHACETLSNCANMQKLIVGLNIPYTYHFDPLMQATESMSHLMKFSLEASCSDMDNLRSYSGDESLYKTLEKLEIDTLNKLGSHHIYGSDVIFWQNFVNLRHITVKCGRIDIFDDPVILFDILPALVLLEVNSFPSDAYVIFSKKLMLFSSTKGLKITR